MMKQLAELETDIKIPRLGFLGVGNVGRSWMETLISEDRTSKVVICGDDDNNIEKALKLSPDIKHYDQLEDLLKEDIDGVVIATPGELHARQAINILEAGKAVFCEQPLGRNQAETKSVVHQAQRCDRLLSVDHAFRYTNGIQAVKELLDEERFGRIYAVEAAYHKASGPEKEWFYNPKISGGGCLMELGSHLVDLILYLFNAPSTEVRYANILASGKSIANHWETVEDFAEAQLCTSSGISIRLGCSWEQSIGKNADIQLKIHGTKGGVVFHNVNGSFKDFQVDASSLNFSETIVTPPDEWQGKAIQKWAERLAINNKFSNSTNDLIKSAALIEDIYNFTRL